MSNPTHPKGKSSKSSPSRTGSQRKTKRERKRKSPSRTGRGPSRTGGRGNTMETREQTARMEKYMEHFSEKFYDRNPKKRYPSHRKLGEIAGGYSVSTVKRDIEVMQRVHKLP